MLDIVVFVRVSIDNLNEFSKSSISINKIELSMNKLIKNKMNIKNDTLIFSLLILKFENIIFVSKMTFG